MSTRNLTSRLIWPHQYRALFDLALFETDETAGGAGHEGNTVHDLYPGDWNGVAARRRSMASALRCLERLGLVERAGRRKGLVVWQTTAAGYDLVFRPETNR